MGPLFGASGVDDRRLVVLDEEVEVVAAGTERIDMFGDLFHPMTSYAARMLEVGRHPALPCVL